MPHIPWRPFAFTALASLASIAACRSEQVQNAPGCSDPCCDGNPTAINCGEHPTLVCTETGDPCVARAYGCMSGSYYLTAPATLPARCTEAGLTGDDSGTFETFDADTDAPLDLDGAAAPPLDAPADSPSDSCTGDGAPDACATP